MKENFWTVGYDKMHVRSSKWTVIEVGDDGRASSGSGSMAGSERKLQRLYNTAADVPYLHHGAQELILPASDGSTKMARNPAPSRSCAS